MASNKRMCAKKQRFSNSADASKKAMFYAKHNKLKLSEYQCTECKNYHLAKIVGVALCAYFIIHVWAN